MDTFLVVLRSDADADLVQAVQTLVESNGGTLQADPQLAPSIFLVNGDSGVQSVVSVADGVVGIFTAALAPIVGSLLVGGVSTSNITSLLTGLMPGGDAPADLAGADDFPADPTDVDPPLRVA
jgi:hypothetical protein